MDIQTIYEISLACGVILFSVYWIWQIDKKLDGNWNNWDEKLGIYKFATKLRLVNPKSY